MSVIGIDFGDESCYIAVARQGGIETLANDYSLRATPSCVAFTEKNRVMGVAALNQTTTNMKNTVSHFKHLIGKKYRDPRVQEMIASLPYTVVETNQGNIGIKVRYQNEERIFTPTEITSMLFTKLKILAESALDIKVNDVVIGVPSYFDDISRHALLMAAQGAGLNVLRLLNETCATALNYGIYKQDLPPLEEKPRNIIFVDCGFSSLQVFATAFNKGKLKMLATASDPNIGGREFDNIIAKKFSDHFKKQYKVDATTNKKAWAKLLSEVEKLKKQMSANSTQLPINIECFMDDKDVSGRMDRAEFEDLAVNAMARVEKTLTACLRDSGLRLEDIHSVEIVGGSSRVPAIKRLIEKVFHQTPSTTLNQDEAVARGCALQCAMLSPAFKVREFSIQDVQPYTIRLLWQDETGQKGDMDVFPKNHQVPFSKLLTFFRRSPFTLQAEYSSADYPGQDRFIASYTINDVAPNADGGSQKVKVKVRVNIHGNFLVASASLTKKEEVLVEEQDAGDATPMETDDKKTATKNGEGSSEEAKEDEQAPGAPADAAPASDAPAAPEATEKKSAGPKKVSRTVDLPLDTISHAPTAGDINQLFESESKMAASDKLENERINAKNAVEEYVYDLRSKLFEELEAFVAEEDRTALSRNLEETENWLYEDGEDCQKQVYVDKLDELKKYGEPIKERRRERLELPGAFEALMSAIQLANKVCDQFAAGDEKFDHLDSAEVEKVQKASSEKLAWTEQQMGAVKATSNFEAVPITSSQVRSELSAFEHLVRPIINKPKPKPKAPTPPPVEKTEENAANTEHQEEDQKTNGPSEDPSKGANEQPMDVD
ncbi:97 kDa heat shock protein isoform X2 [Hyalella azteca]|uniref:97 kDa heat shock protein isoform X2 n=1 Tax=Hyalella azteca TaxID=294128 RepID=A0A8B7P7W5_HYAAZ|nr:97 kDa heat shock protein isoform X2 [Hyalella azteca]